MAMGAMGAAVAGIVAATTAGAAPHVSRPPGHAPATAVPAAQQLTQAGSASAHILSLRPRLVDGSVLAQLRLPRVSAPVNLVEGLGQNPDEVGHDSRTGYPGEPRSMLLVGGTSLLVPTPAVGDSIRVDTSYGGFQYQVSGVHPTAPGADLGPDAPDLRLVYHTGGGLAVIIADLVPGDPNSAAELAQEIAVTRAERTAEADAIAAGGTVQLAPGHLYPPVTGPITQLFGPVDFALEFPFTYQGVYYPHFHTGLDLGVVTGTPVRAANAGTVVLATTNTGPDGKPVGYGTYVLIYHGGNLFTLYGHLSQLGVTAGQKVATGQVIGLSGSTGNSTGPHLHFEVRQGQMPVDPLPLIRGGG
jgi:murein DD-endopeptidase MepM/ murein hydrolase activator NlpD